MFAVIETGGKQYKVKENDVLKIEKLEGSAGTTIKFEKVLALGDGTSIKAGTPAIEGAVVSAEILEQKKDKKVIVFKKKRRHHYRRKNGHRQPITVIRIMDVSGKGGVVKAPEKKKFVKAEAAESAESAPSAKTAKAAKAPSVKKEAKKAEPKKEAKAPKAEKEAGEKSAAKKKSAPKAEGSKKASKKEEK